MDIPITIDNDNDSVDVDDDGPGPEQCGWAVDGPVMKLLASSVAPRDPIWRILLGCCCCRLLLLWALAIVLGSGSLELWSYGATELPSPRLKVVYFEKSPSPDRGLCRRLGI